LTLGNGEIVEAADPVGPFTTLPDAKGSKLAL
jgi:hypothetical protein